MHVDRRDDYLKRGYLTAKVRGLRETNPPHPMSAVPLCELRANEITKILFSSFAQSYTFLLKELFRRQKQSAKVS